MNYFIPPACLQYQWVYRTFEDVKELERERGTDDKAEEEESPFRPFPVENGSDHDENGTNGAG